MKLIGMLATAVGLASLTAGGLLLVRSLPELRRYLKIRNM